MNIPTSIDLYKLPRHVAVIMDGNGRWAKQKGNMRIFGHRSAIQSVRDVTEGCAELGIPFLTLYAFSTENWNRPKLEVQGLMHLLVETLRSEAKTLIDNNIRLTTIGNIEALPKDTRLALDQTIRQTEGNSRMTLTLALSYGSRLDITQAVKRIAQAVESGSLSPENIDEQTISRHLSTAYLPDPELLIRTSGEFRISNFLLWELAYTEIYITAKLWPDFRKEDLHQAIIDFQQRERRFGKTGEQIANLPS